MPKWEQETEDFIFSLQFPEDHTELKKSLDDIFNVIEGKIPISIELLDKFTKMFFKSGKGAYLGIESRLPSEFLDIYPSWLKYHAEYLRNLTEEQIKKGGRLLIVKSLGELHNDRSRNTYNFNTFVNWHKENSVPLFYISKEKAEQLRKKYDLESTDVALWENSYAVIFKHDEHGNKSVKIFVIEKGHERFKRILNYVNELKDAAQIIDPNKLLLISPELAVAWKGYTGSLQDRKHIHGFLHKVLKRFENGRGIILDAAAGIGNEVIYLLKKGFSVEANEVDPTFSEQLLLNIASDDDLKEKGITPEYFRRHLYCCDWRYMSSEIPANSLNAILVLGNSLSMILNKDDRRKCLEEFYKILKPGGMLIIDERNYPKIISELKRGIPVYGKSVMYPSPEIECQLKLGDGDEIVWFEFYTKDGKKIGEPIPTANLRDNLRGELENVFKAKAKVFSDLEPIDPPSHDAIFRTYIITKPTEIYEKQESKEIKIRHDILQMKPKCVIYGSEKETKQWGVLGKSNGQLIKLDLDAPHVLFVCGKPGSGKGYTIGVICEMLVSESITGLSKVLNKATIIVFHYPREPNKKSEFWSITRPNDQQLEVDKLRKEYGVEPQNLISEEKLKIFVDPNVYEKDAQEFKLDYGTENVYPICLDPKRFTAEDWKVVLSGGGKLYTKKIFSIIERLQFGQLNLHEIRKQILSNNLLSKSQQRLAEFRLSLLERYLSVKDSDIVSNIAIGGVNILDFRKIISEPEDIFAIVSLVFSILQSSKPQKSPFVFVINEAHNFFRNGESKKLVDNILYMIRRIRHEGNWLLLDTQLPEDVDERLIKIADIKIVHKLDKTIESKILKRAFGKVADNFSDLGQGQAYVVADQSSKGRFKPSFVNIRPRITKHGAATQTSV